MAAVPPQYGKLQAKGKLLSQGTYTDIAKAFKQKLIQTTWTKDTIQSDCKEEYKIFLWHLSY